MAQQPPPVCLTCGEVGHFTLKCPRVDEKTDFRPAGVLRVAQRRLPEGYGFPPMPGVLIHKPVHEVRDECLDLLAKSAQEKAAMKLAVADLLLKTDELERELTNIHERLRKADELDRELADVSERLRALEAVQAERAAFAKQRAGGTVVYD